MKPTRPLALAACLTLPFGCDDGGSDAPSPTPDAQVADAQIADSQVADAQIADAGDLDQGVSQIPQITTRRIPASPLDQFEIQVQLAEGEPAPEITVAHGEISPVEGGEGGRYAATVTPDRTGELHFTVRAGVFSNLESRIRNGVGYLTPLAAILTNRRHPFVIFLPS